MSIYTVDIDEVGKQLTPPKLRQLKFLAWVRVILAPLKWAYNDFFTEYCQTTEDGSNEWNSGTTYNTDDRVLWTNKRGYVCIKDSCLNIEPTGNSQSAEYWLEFTTNYVAVDERLYYKPQIIWFVRALNAYFRTGLFQIYVTSGAGSVAIYFPIAYYLPLGATNTERDKAILDFCSKYLPAGVGVADVTISTY